jgi:hypothetical protein
MRLALIVSAVLASSVLAGCSSVQCSKCHHTVSADNVVCMDCYSHQGAPLVVDAPDDPPPVHRPPRKVEPTPVVDPAPTRAASPWVVFLNKFPQSDSDAVEQELLSLRDFVDVTPGGGDAGRRVSLELKYTGANIKRDLVAVMRKLGFRFHFTEARLQGQIELVKE